MLSGNNTRFSLPYCILTLTLNAIQAWLTQATLCTNTTPILCSFTLSEDSFWVTLGTTCLSNLLFFFKRVVAIVDARQLYLAWHKEAKAGGSCNFPLTQTCNKNILSGLRKGRIFLQENPQQHFPWSVYVGKWTSKYLIIKIQILISNYHHSMHYLVISTAYMCIRSQFLA